MKKIINRKTYNTDTADIVSHKTSGEWGDPKGYEEILYKTRKGDYFIYGIGGDDSKYPKETIIATTADEAKNF